MKTAALLCAILSACNIIYADERALEEPVAPVEICQTAACHRTASAILKNMDKDVQPCDDFYRFACGSYLRSHVIPDDKSSDYYVFSEIQEQLSNQLRQSVEEPISSSEPKPFIVVKTLYKSCMDTSKIDGQGTKPLLQTFAQLGGWILLDGNSKIHRWTDYVYTLRKLGMAYQMFMSVNVEQDDKNSSRRRVFIDQPALGLSREFLIKGLEEENVKAYYKYMVEMAVYLGIDRTIAERELQQSLMFEIELARISVPAEDRRDGEKLYNLMTLKELSGNYTSIPWKEYINNVLLQDFQVEEDDQIVVKVPSFFKEFEQHMQNTSENILTNYVFWRVAKSSASFLNENVRNMEFDFKKVTTGVKEQEPRWKQCLQLVSDNLVISVGAMYVRKYFQKEAKAQIMELVNRIVEEFKSNLDTVKWMDDQTKSRTVEKANAILKFVAYPEELLDNNELEKYYSKLTFQSDEYFNQYFAVQLFRIHDSCEKLNKPVIKNDWTVHSQSAVVNAYYSAADNSIEFPAGILQGHFFDKDRPRYLNFAAIGSVIGHEITHGFDDEGSQYDKEGNLVNWWEPETKAKYLEETKCIVDQYSNFTAKEVNMSVNGVNTQGENVGDNGGIKIAYQAFNKSAEGNPSEGVLPGLQDFTQKQLFWITAANLWCGIYRPESLRDAILNDPHAPPEFRVIGPFSNMREFSQDFNCTLGSNMNPEKKCSVW